MTATLSEKTTLLFKTTISGRPYLRIDKQGPCHTRRWVVFEETAGRLIEDDVRDTIQKDTATSSLEWSEVTLKPESRRVGVAHYNKTQVVELREYTPGSKAEDSPLRKLVLTTAEWESFLGQKEHVRRHLEGRPVGLSVITQTCYACLQNEMSGHTCEWFEAPMPEQKGAPGDDAHVREGISAQGEAGDEPSEGEELPEPPRKQPKFDGCKKDKKRRSFFY